MTAGVDLPFTKDPLPQNFNSLAISLSQSTAMSKRKADIQLIRRGKSHSEPPVFTPNTACSSSNVMYNLGVGHVFHDVFTS
jgi:hypothetical protein